MYDFIVWRNPSEWTGDIFMQLAQNQKNIQAEEKGSFFPDLNKL